LNRKKEELLRSRIHEINTIIAAEAEEISKGALTKFAEIICPKMTLDFLSMMSARQIFDFVQTRFAFIEKSFPQGLTVAVTPFSVDDNGKQTSAAVLEIILRDRPFVADSLTEYIHEQKYQLSLMFYPVISIDHNAENRIINIRRISDDPTVNYTFVCAIIENLTLSALETLKSEVLAVLEMVRYVTDDFKHIVNVVDEYAHKEKKDESESLMESERRRLFTWFNNGNVILLGAGEVFKADISNQLGWEHIHHTLGYVRRKKDLNDPQLPKEIGRLSAFFLESGLIINIIELTEVSVVHRRDRIQVVFRRKRDENGNVTIVFLYILFTNKSHKEAAMAIPLARLKVNAILEKSIEGENIEEKQGHVYKIAHDFFNSLPKSELFRLDRAELTAIFDQFVYFGDYQQTRLSMFTQPARRYARLTFCTPNSRFSQEVFLKIDQMLSRKFHHGSELKYWFQLGRNAYAYYIYWFPADHPQLSDINTEELEKEAISFTLGWEDEFQTLLGQLPPEQRASLTAKYASVFGSFYQAVFSPQDALTDLSFLEALLTTDREQVDLRDDERRSETVVYVYSKRRYHLTEIMPLLQNLALTVIDENTYHLTVGKEKLFIYTYYVKSLKEQSGRFERFRDHFCDLLLAVLESRTENDVLNGLLLTAGLDRREINLFILYRNYYWQIGAPYLPVNRSFLDNAAVMIALKDYFVAKFDPAIEGNSVEVRRLAEFQTEALKAIEQVKTVAEDIIFKTVFNLMDATIRTNYFNIDEHSTMAIKIESGRVGRMPSPKPLYEIYIHGAHLEGIHLRGAMIARGGLRYSDRPADFRSEVLGLMNTQMLKNVVIVPEGSKGGFILKRQFTDRRAQTAEVVSQYKTYINSLLSLTDNIVGGQVVPAAGLVRYDGDDPYLVVAADKGTAALSDTANEISYRRGFWLKDAFASGGKHGYDHKKMAITARGAWECVKLHFLQESKDIQNTPFSVIGIGDMSGDVFGNGMLLSRFIQLKGAFNHLHIFVDPNPDPQISWQERERLFHTPGSTWMDYQANLISRGGGIFERTAKSIPLSDEIRKLVGTSQPTVSGEELIKLLLQCPADLLWNGGIGTYIKSSHETSVQVADAANDAVRINADQLRVKVIGEGGNLGLTQQARLEAAAKGIKLNTDAIDNSGGVDTSDHEVNLKILLDALITEGQIPSPDIRNRLLEELTDDIAELVLKDNINQCQIISMDNLRTQKDLSPVLDLIPYLIERKLLGPKPENISSREQMEACFNSGNGVLRPDLALLLSYSKMHFYKEIVSSPKLADPLLDEVYTSYFPGLLRSRYDISRFQHPLKKEIIGTVLSNKTVNQAGITLLPTVLSIVDSNPVDIIVSYVVLDQLFQLDDLRNRVMAELRVSNLNAAYTLLINIEKFIRSLLLWMLIYFDSETLQFSLIDTFREAVGEYLRIFEKIMDPEEKQQIQNTQESLTALGVSMELARDLARGDFMRKSLEDIVLSQKSGISLENAIILSQGIDAMFHFKELNTRILKTESKSPWGKRHKGLLIKQLILLKQQVTETILSRYAAVSDDEERLQRFLDDHKVGFKKYQIDYTNLMSTEAADLSGITILLEMIAQLMD